MKKKIVLGLMVATVIACSACSKEDKKYNLDMQPDATMPTAATQETQEVTVATTVAEALTEAPTKASIFNGHIPAIVGYTSSTANENTWIYYAGDIADKSLNLSSYIQYSVPSEAIASAVEKKKAENAPEMKLSSDKGAMVLKKGTFAGYDAYVGESHAFMWVGEELIFVESEDFADIEAFTTKFIEMLGQVWE